MTAIETQPTDQSIIDELVQRAAKELQEEIDFRVMADLYKQSGWTEIEFDSWHLVSLDNPVRQWLRGNSKGHYINRGKRFLFERESDAINFVLRWSE